LPVGPRALLASSHGGEEDAVARKLKVETAFQTGVAIDKAMTFDRPYLHDAAREILKDAEQLRHAGNCAFLGRKWAWCAQHFRSGVPVPALG